MVGFSGQTFAISRSKSSTTAKDPAKSAAIQAAKKYFHDNIKADIKVGYSGRGSQDYTKDELDRQIGYLSKVPNGENIWKKYYQGLRQELEIDPSLKIFNIMLTTGSGDTGTQDQFLVRVKDVNGELSVNVMRSR